jgi:hypothetical protein
MNKIRKAYRLQPILVEKIQRSAKIIGCSNTSIVERALNRYFAQSDKYGFKAELNNLLF